MLPCMMSGYIQMRSSIILAEFTIGFKCSLCTWKWSYTIWGGPPFSFDTSGQHQSCMATCFVEPSRSPSRTFTWWTKIMTCMLSDEFRQKLRAKPCCLLMCLCQAKKKFDGSIIDFEVDQMFPPNLCIERNGCPLRHLLDAFTNHALIHSRIHDSVNPNDG